MRKFTFKVILCTLFCALSFFSKAQLTGSKTIPGDYATIANAVLDLNTLGVGTGGVTFNIAAGYTETAPTGGIVLGSGTLNALLSSSNPIIFQKSGSGTNPVITAFTGTSTTTDGIFKLQGTDYVTIDGIDLAEAVGNTTTTTTMEWGYALVKRNSATPFDGCQFVNIKNCTISLNLGTNANTYGIYIGNHVATSTTALTITANSDANSNNKFNGNTITANSGFRITGYLAAASPYTLYDQNNEIGVTNPNIIPNHGGGGAATYGVYEAAQNNFKCNNNSILGGSGTTTTHYGIYLAASSINANLTVDNNIIDIINSSTTSQVCGIASSPSASVLGTTNTVLISNNVIKINRTAATTGVTYFVYSTSNYTYNFSLIGNNIGGSSSSLSGTGAVYGFYNISGPDSVNIIGNTFANITRTSTTSTGLFYAIYHTSGSITKQMTIANNNIYALKGNGSTGAIGGINISGPSPLNIVKNNRIYDIESDNAGGVVNGIVVGSGGVTNYIYNNFISDLRTPNSTGTTDVVRAFNITSTTASSTIHLYYNTVYLNATSLGAIFSTTGVYHTYSTTATTAALYMKNNIIVNTSTPNGTGITAAFRRSAATNLNNINTSDNNDFYAGTPSTSRLIYYDGTNSYASLAAYKVGLSPKDASSFSELPPFINVASTPYNLRLQTTIATQCESGGLPITTPVAITTDYDGMDVRDGTSPDVGADEFNGIAADLTAPLITYTNLVGDCNTGNKILSNVVITDGTGITLTGSLIPRIYYKKGVGGTWFSQSGTYVSGTTNNSTWDFTIVAADMGGLTATNQVFYYVIAQDSAAVPNNGSSPSGVIANSVNDVTTHPTTPNSYTIFTTFAAGTPYTINSAAPASATNFVSFNSLVTALSTSCLSGNVVVEVSNGPYTEQIIIPSITGASASNTLTINGNGQIITDGGAAITTKRAVIELNNADYITINNLVVNTGSGTHGYGFHLRNDADHNTISNCTVTTNLTGTTTLWCGIVVNSNDVPQTTGDSKCDSNIIIGNTVKGGFYCIALVASGTTFEINGNQVKNNLIQDFYSYGIYMNGNNNTLIEGNDISRPARTAATNFYGIYLLTGNRNIIISKNKIHDPFSAYAATSTNAAYGLNFATSVNTLGNENIISNNTVYNFKGNGAALANGIQNGIINTASPFVKYFNNSIALDDATSTAGDTRGFYQTTIADGIEFKNNIVKVSRGGTGEKQCVYYNTAGSTITADYNDLYMGSVAGTNIAIGRYHTPAAFHTTIESWQAASGQDFNSTSKDPAYTSSSDLTPTSGEDLIGVNSSYVTTDIVGTTRLNPPAMGAYEVSLPGIWSTTAATTNFDTPSNWRDNAAPTPFTTIYVPPTSSNMPVKNSPGTSIYARRVINNGTIKVIGAGIMATGNIYNNGYIDLTQGFLSLQGTAPQMVKLNGTSGNINTTYFTISNAAGATISRGVGIGRINVSVELDFGNVNNSVLKTGGFVTLKSNVGGTARVADVTNGGTNAGNNITGDVTLERYIAGGKRAFRFLAHPFNAAMPLSQVTDDIDITGNGSDVVGGFTESGTNNPSAFYYDPTTGDGNTVNDLTGWKPYTAAANTVGIGNGYRVLVRGAKGNLSPVTPAAVTLSSTGVLNASGDFVKALTYQATLPSFNLIGNPYASPVNVKTLTKTAGVNNNFWIWNARIGTAGAYIPYTFGTSDYSLPSSTSFFVQTTGAGETVTFKEADKTASDTSTMLRQTPVKGMVEMTINTTDGMWDRFALFFDRKGKSGTDIILDGAKMHNSEVNFYSINTDKKALSIDVRPYDAETVIPMGFTSNKQRTYTINVNAMNVDGNNELYLSDKYLGTITKLEAGTSYEFTVDANAASQGEQRFELFGKAVKPIAITTEFAVSLAPNPATDFVKVSFTNKVQQVTTVRILNANGSVVKTINAGSVQNGQLTVPVKGLAKGIYTVQLTSGTDTKTSKLVIQ